MNLTDQTRYIELFFSNCLGIIRQKNPDYAPDGIPLLDLMSAAADTDITIPKALWILGRKQWSAIRKHFILNQPLKSETIYSRLQDEVNYLALLGFYETYKAELHRAWRNHWEGQRCECVYDDPHGQRNSDLCEKCKALRWLEKQAFAVGSAPTSSRSTRKGQG